MDQELKPEQKPDKGGPRYTLEVQDVHATLDLTMLFGQKEQPDGKKSE